MADSVESPREAGRNEWLVLFYQLPAKHSPARVKVWRRLQRIGAVSLKGSAYLLPNGAEAREDFEWIRGEILAIGGQATVMATAALDSAVRQEIIELFRTARGRDFRELGDEARALRKRFPSRRPSGPARRRLAQSVRRLRERFRETEVIDFYDAPQRAEAAQVLNELDLLMRRGQILPKRSAPPTPRLDVKDYRGRVWVTRPRPGVDRMSSAWLIRRFVDPHARFAFGESTRKGMIPFDVFGAELGHQGTSCTFETIARSFGIEDEAVAWLGRIVHDLDLKEETYDVPEKAAVGRMVEGLRRMYPDDQMLIREGIILFEALYRSYEEKAEARARPTSQRARRPGKGRGRRRGEREG